MQNLPSGPDVHEIDPSNARSVANFWSDHCPSPPLYDAIASLVPCISDFTSLKPVGKLETNRSRSAPGQFRIEIVHNVIIDCSNMKSHRVH